MNTNIDNLEINKPKKVRFSSAINLPTEPTHLTEQFDSTDLTNPTELFEPTDLTEQTDPTDPTDVFDEDEDEILNDNVDILDDLDKDDPLTETVKNVYNIFLSKYEHLANFKSKKIILEICKMTVNAMPDFYAKPHLYMSFIESYINMIKHDIPDKESFITDSNE
jgi:hypothetical protein